MTDDPGPRQSPLRIELATSEIDGGNCLAWADPAQVLGLVVLSRPEDTFSRMVEPRLSNLDEGGYGEDSPTDSLAHGAESPDSALPRSVRTLVDRLQEIHLRLVQENQSLHRTARQVEVTSVLAEEDRIYLVKTGTSWICLLREGRAYAAEANAPRVDGRRPALGGAQNLRCEVTSIPVRVGDTFILLTTAADVPVDAGALVSLFAQTSDLKRACDGLVNLMGLQAQGASAVALRFVPIGRSPGEPERENPLFGLTTEFSSSSEVEESIDSLLSQILPTEAGQPATRPNDDAAVSVLPEAGNRLPGTTGLEESEPAEVPVLAGTSGVARSVVSPTKRRRMIWPVVLAFLAILAVLAVALPKVGFFHLSLGGIGKSVHPNGAGGARGTVLIEPDPPARRVFIDGQSSGEETPVRLEGITPGKHLLGLDLGPCGIWETEITVEKDGTPRIAPRLMGSVGVTAADPSTGGRVWTEGREKTPVPATLDSLPVGWNRLFYEDSRLPMWDRQVLVRVGQKAEIVVPNHFSSSQGLIKVESLTYVDRQGMVDSEGDTVRIDGREIGRTPVETTLAPGFHSVRVTGSDGSTHAEVLDVRAGGARHVSALLGRGPKPDFRHVPPGRVLVRGPLLLTVEIQGIEVGPGTRPTLHLPELPAGAREVPLVTVDAARGVYVGAVESDAIPIGRPVAYYFTLVDGHGDVVCSDLFTFYPVRRLSETTMAVPAGGVSSGGGGLP